MTQVFLELLENIKRTGYRLLSLQTAALAEGKDDIADLLRDAHDAVFQAQLILESQKED